MRIPVNGVTLDVHVEGEGRPVVLLHGFPDSKRLWAKQIPVLVEAGFKVIVPDQRGYGASEKPDGVDPYSIVFLTLDVVGILDHLEIPRGMWWGTTGAPLSPGEPRRSHPTASTISSRCQLATRRRSPRLVSPSARSRGTCCCSTSRASPSSGSR